MKNESVVHIPVLLDEVLEKLSLQPDDSVLDCTTGAGGHSEAICRKLGKRGRLFCLDADAEAVERAEKRLKRAGCRPVCVTENFRNLDRVLDVLQVPFVSKIVFDLGLSSVQLDSSGRGFSFRTDEPLFMTFAAAPSPETLTVSQILNEWSEETLVNIITGYGEERFAKRIAQAIVAARLRKKISTTRELSALISEAVPLRFRHGRLHPATKTFQALRIAVNDELEALKEALAKGFSRLAPGGRIAVISFHSLEDRIVKRFFRERVREGRALFITRHPITPQKEERERNPRARSAKLRVIEKTMNTPMSD